MITDLFPSRISVIVGHSLKVETGGGQLEVLPKAASHSLVLLCASLAIREGSMKHAPGFLAIVNEAKSRVKELSFREVKQRLDVGEKLTLVDVREDNEWARGHLPAAIHLGKGVIERDIEMAVPDKSATLVLYCGGGFRSALAADNLRKMGYTNCISMDGGWRSWTEAGFPTDKE
jgi:rhodanese-related sulfurtransferase